MSRDRRELSGEVEAKERAVLVSVVWGDSSEVEAEESLAELLSLAETAGAVVIGSIMQSRSRPDPATLLGKGKLEELRRMVSEDQADLVIFDQELSPFQQRNLEDALGIKVLDRTALILDIFAQHAHSKEGKAQVEMAQLRYQLTRLTGRGSQLSRLGGGIGTRGPGETKLEVDRRRINIRIKTLNRELRELTRVRRLKRKRRARLEIPTFSLVGYTNAGKSSLINRLTDAGVLVEDGLFSTLDPTTRRVALPGNRYAVITDTVGFINHLPHQLVEAFKSTLEEVREADVLLHVIDASAPNIERRTRAVEEVLEEIGALDIPAIYVLNKVDLLGEEDKDLLRRKYPGAVLTSAVTGEGVTELVERMASCIPTPRPARLRIPVEESGLLSLLYRRGKVTELSVQDRHYRLLADIPPELVERFRPFMEDDGD